MDSGKILVIDRDRFYRELYHDLLSGVGYEVYTPASYELSNTDVGRFDVIIYEPNSREGQIGSMLERMKSVRYLPEVLVVTSQSVASAQSSMPGGAVHYTYIKKPFDDSKFLHVVTNIIAQRRLFIEKEKLAKEGMEYLILLEVYKRSSDILSQGSTDGVLKKLIDAVVVELKLARAMLWFRSSDDTMGLAHSFGYETAPYDEQASINWKTFGHRAALKDGHFISDSGDVMYLLIQGQDGSVYAMLRLTKKGSPFSIQDTRVAKTLATFGGIAISNAIKLSQKVTDTLRADNLPAYSYRYFLEYTENEIKRSHRMHSMFSIAVISVENYRELVEAFSKSYLDEVFLKITNLINEVIRDADTLSISEHSNMLNLFLPDTDYFGSIITMRRIKNQLKHTLYITDGSITKHVEMIIGSSTYPNDGSTAQTLLAKAYDMAQRSKTGRLKEIASLESLGFTEFSDNILRIFNRPDQNEGEVTSAIFTTTKEHLMDIVNLLSGDMLARPFMRGLMFLGMPSVTGEARILKEQYKLYSSNTKFYLLGKKSHGEFIDISYAPIMIINEDIGSRYFIFNLNEEYAYGLVTDEIKDSRFSVFHTSDPMIVEELIAVLQEKYFLQRQI
ncbi:MAG: diguanylate cyclase [Deltaproteobacteria bacterium]|nr:diguanylate cyclase [Deltaproteobacteria bacterium]